MNEHSILLDKFGVLGNADLLVKVKYLMVKMVEVVDIQPEDDDHGREEQAEVKAELLVVADQFVDVRDHFH